MSLRLILPCKAYSVNDMFYGNRNILKTEYRNWQIEILHYLNSPEIQSNIQKFTEEFNPLQHGISVFIEYYFPKEVLLIKTGSLSARAFDCSNMEKTLIDVLMLEKHSTESVKNVSLDDKYIVELNSKKLIAEKHEIRIEFKIIFLSNHLDTKPL